jgi:hypothetical protein
MPKWLPDGGWRELWTWWWTIPSERSSILRAHLPAHVGNGVLYFCSAWFAGAVFVGVLAHLWQLPHQPVLYSLWLPAVVWSIKECIDWEAMQEEVWVGGFAWWEHWWDLVCGVFGALLAAFITHLLLLLVL